MYSSVYRVHRSLPVSLKLPSLNGQLTSTGGAIARTRLSDMTVERNPWKNPWQIGEEF